MTPAEEMDRLVRAWERNYITTGEFESRMMEYLGKLPSAEANALLKTLAAHASEEVRRAAEQFQRILRHEELSKDLDYVRQHSPLRPGVRLEMFGGYDYYSTGGKPWWLNGREFYMATFLGFAPRGENRFPAGLVEFDEATDVPGHRGRFAILVAGPDSESIAWGRTEDEVAVYVVEALPEDIATVDLGDASQPAIETHATYRVTGGTGTDAGGNPA